MVRYSITVQLTVLLYNTMIPDIGQGNGEQLVNFKSTHKGFKYGLRREQRILVGHIHSGEKYKVEPPFTFRVSLYSTILLSLTSQS